MINLFDESILDSLERIFSNKPASTLDSDPIEVQLVQHSRLLNRAIAVIRRARERNNDCTDWEEITHEMDEIKNEIGEK